jgi:hypothetical protein
MITPFNTCKSKQPIDNVLHMHSGGLNETEVLPSLFSHSPSFFLLEELRKTGNCPQWCTHIVSHRMKKGLQVFVA